MLRVVPQNSNSQPFMFAEWSHPCGLAAPRQNDTAAAGGPERKVARALAQP